MTQIIVRMGEYNFRDEMGVELPIISTMIMNLRVMAALFDD